MFPFHLLFSGVVSTSLKHVEQMLPSRFIWVGGGLGHNGLVPSPISCYSATAKVMLRPTFQTLACFLPFEIWLCSSVTDQLPDWIRISAARVFFLFVHKFCAFVSPNASLSLPRSSLSVLALQHGFAALQNDVSPRSDWDLLDSFFFFWVTAK